MANNQKFKVNQLAKDFNIKTKEIIDIFVSKGNDKITAQKTLDPDEFDLFFNIITLKNQLTNIDAYLNGETFIPSPKLPEPVKKQESAPAQAEQKPEEKPATKASAQPAPSAAAPAPAQSPAAKTPAPARPAQQRPDQSRQPNAYGQNTGTSAQSRPSSGSAAANMPKGRPQDAQTASHPMQRTPAAAGNRPAGAAMGTPGQRTPYGAGQQSRPQQSPLSGFGGYQRPAPGFGAKPQQDRKPNQGHSGSHFDKDDHVSSGPREKFQPQAINRGQTPKGTTSSQKSKGTRVVDIRGDSQVDLSKYDEKLDTLVPDAALNARGGNQKLRKQPVSSRQEMSSGKGGQKDFKNAKKAAPIKHVLNITIPDEIVVSDLASRLKVSASELVKKLMMMGMMVTINQTIDFDTAALVSEEFGAKYTREVVVTIEERLFDDSPDQASDLVPRAPVICVMGHVDHGKTSILDAIRNTHVTAGEAGGITQHIGAYRVNYQGKDITFLDTPGHEAFTAMRARGAQATDIAILVVAADDGIMPQTVEAINHAKAAGIDIIVAINKMDKPGADPENVKQELTKYDLVPEEWGGDVMCVPVSALTHQGIDDLLEAVLLVAEVKEMKANPNRRAKGIVIESKLDKGRGPVATVLVQNGTLHAGDIVIAGTAVGRVRAMYDHNGRSMKTAGPSVPAEIIGLDEVPQAGDEFNGVENERMARELADRRRSQAKEEVFKASSRANLDDLFAQISEGIKELNIIVKADVDGSVEAVKQSLEKISNDEVKVRVIHAAVGGIRENDVMLAAASNAIIVGFNVRPDKAAIDSAERQGVDIRTYSIIYECIEEITAAIKGMLAPKYREALLGHAEVRQTIHVPNVGTVAGSYVQDGKVTRQSEIRVVRDGVVIFTDKIASLRRFKDDVREVASGYECGIALERFNDIKIGDVLEAFVMEEIEQA